MTTELTKYKPSNLADQYLTYGVYFKSDNDLSTEYFIELRKYNDHAVVNIFTIPRLSDYFDTNGLENGMLIGMDEWELTKVVEVELWGKYFFPVFTNDYQFYYDDHKYYGQDYKSDQIMSLAEVINFAIEYGLREAGIKPY